MNDREWDIFMMEIEARNEGLIQEFLISQMRPRDIEALMAQGEQQEALPAPAEGVLSA
jgi:hypothetical protein